MDKTYQPENIEQKWYQFWESNQLFTANDQNKDNQTAYSIMIPPPNVTGTLHMGHAFQDTIMDILTRFQRMNGCNTLWQPGTDHAGIATQMVVERQLNQQGQTRHDLGRNVFVERIWEWKAQSGGMITQQLRRLGASTDWQRERFTMDEGLSRAVREVFVQLYKEGLIYRGQRLVNWDPVLKTAVSDLEVESVEEKGSLWHLRYPVAETHDYVVVATTRPETMLGDTAVAVHPDDARYRHLIGKMINLPFCDRQIPIIADEYVDLEFGTGCVKITPAHDFNDYEMGKRHQLPLINIFNDDASINNQMPAAYRGLDRFEARQKLVADFEAAGLLDKIEPHTLKIPRCDRTQQVVEPYLTNQWYVDAKTLAEPAIAAVRDKRVQFVPENWEKTYFEWMNNIQDWCISRQLWWGHRIPAWYDAEGQIYVGRDEAEVRREYNLNSEIVLTQDEDVLDTWFSSALWPFSTLGWPEKTAALSTFYPTSVLVTGFDIIFFWVARMIMMGLYVMKDVPFKEVYIHGLVRDQDGQKMSKSKGNVLDPLDLIDGIDLESLVKKRTTGLMQPQMAPAIEAATRKHFPEGIKPFGTDALRFTFSTLATNGRDIIFDVGRIEGNRNFCNKIWNAARFVFMNTEDKPREYNASLLSFSDQWIESRLNSVARDVRRHLNSYRFDLASQLIYEFIWNEFCDWYLELAKVTLQTSTESQQAATRYQLLKILEAILRLIHPFMPFISEEIWQQLIQIAPEFKPDSQSVTSISLTQYPDFIENNESANSLGPYNLYHGTTLNYEMQWVQSVLLEVRRIRAEMNIAPGKLLPLLYQATHDEETNRMQRHALVLQKLGRLESLTALTGEAPESAVALVEGMQLMIPLAGLIDKAQEMARLQREIDKLLPEIDKLSAKLSNEGFTAKAPLAVVEKEQARLQGMQHTAQELSAQLEKICALV